MQDYTLNTEIYSLKPTQSLVRDNCCSRDRRRRISCAKQRPGQSSERHQAPAREVCVPSIPAQCFAKPGGACQHRQSTEPLEGPAWEKRMFCTELTHVQAQPPGRSCSLSQPWWQSKSFCNDPEVQNKKPVRKPSKIPLAEARRSCKHVGPSGKEQHPLIVFTLENRVVVLYTFKCQLK